MALTDLTDAQLHNLNGSSVIPPQVINAEILRRSQMTNSAGATTKLPAMANADTNPIIANNPLLQGFSGFQPPAQMGEQTTPTPQQQLGGDNFAYPTFEQKPMDGYPAQPARFGGSANPGVDFRGQPLKDNSILNLLDKLAPAKTDGYTVPADAIPGAGAPLDTSALNADNAAQLAFVDKMMGGVGGGKPPLVPGNVKPDYQKYYDQVAKEMPDNTGDLKDAIKAQRAKAELQGSNAFGQAMMTAGLSMLGSRQPFFQALGEAGKQGIGQYNAQKETADTQLQRAMGTQATLAQIDQGRQGAISQGATARGMEDVRAQQDNARNQIAAYSAQFGPAMVKAQMMGARLALMKDPIITSATDVYQRQVALAGELMKSPFPGAQEKAIMMEQNARKIYEAAIAHRSSGVGALLPEQQVPAAQLR